MSEINNETKKYITVDYYGTIKKLSDVEQFFSALYAANIIFHPEDEFYQNYDCLTDEEGLRLDKIMEQVYEYCEPRDLDPCDLAMDVYERITNENK